MDPQKEKSAGNGSKNSNRPQPEHLLQNYLSDHLAGSVAGIELTQHLIENSSGPQKEKLQNLLPHIQEDQKVLKDIFARIGGSQNPLKKTASWLGEKLTEAKFSWERSKHQAQGDVIELEALALGIAGKRSLWVLFEEVFPEDDRFSDLDFGYFKERAAHQYKTVDRLRLEAARKAFGR